MSDTFPPFTLEESTASLPLATLRILFSDFRIANVRFSIQFSPFHKLTTNVNFSFFAMKILNKLAGVDVLAGSCNILNDR